MKIYGKEVCDDDPVESLELLSQQIGLDLLNIKNQIEEAKAKAAVEGIYAPADWMARAKHALRLKGLQHQYLLREIAKRKKNETRIANDKLSKEFERRFIAVAKNMLPEEVFLSLIEATNRAVME